MKRAGRESIRSEFQLKAQGVPEELAQRRAVSSESKGEGAGGGERVEREEKISQLCQLLNLPARPFGGSALTEKHQQSTKGDLQ